MEDQQQVTTWEKENKDRITGWEVHYGYEEPGTKTWVPYDGYKIIIYKIGKETTQFKIAR